MKRRLMTVLAVAAFVMVCILTVSCDPEHYKDGGEGEIRLFFESVADGSVRAVTEMPDTSDFLLTIQNASGNIVYDGKYGDCPESLEVASGNYTVTVRSINFTKPAFDSPLYGDSQCVVVERDGIVNVGLVCRQLNSGIRLSVVPEFLTSYPDGVLYLKSSEGKLMYSYSEKRIAYFNPGAVSLILSINGKDDLLMTRELEPQEILVLGVGVAASETSAGNKGISIAVDTTRNWIADRYVIGGGGSDGGSIAKALNVAQARTMAPMNGVWVSGYIVGGDLTTASGNFEEPFKSKSNLILGPRSSTTDRSVCIAVQLPSGSIRDELNLVDNPSLLGSKVSLHGNLVTDYFNLVGLKNLDDVEY